MRYVSVTEEVRKVTADCLISFNGNCYSVPWMFAKKMVWIKVSNGYFLEIYSQANKLIARHKMSLDKGQVIIKTPIIGVIRTTMETGNGWWSCLTSVTRIKPYS
ncbi:MAG: hypothetical protein H6627_10765 [Calditrichae bacterium]|nr:hypothetical protein [Calditrichia bacterium]